MQKLKEKVLTQIIIIYTRYLIGGTFVFASLIKIKGKRFTSESGANEPIDSAWHFFETMYASGLYWKFIGIGQLVAGCLLMTQRFAKAGAIVFLPIIGNIFVITLSYYFAFTPVITGMMLLANLGLIAWDWDSLRILVNQTPLTDTRKRLENDLIWQYTGISLFLFTFLYRVAIDQYDIFLWGGICFMIGVTGLVMGLKRRKRYS
jgi:hypothetical protein